MSVTTTDTDDSQLAPWVQDVLARVIAVINGKGGVGKCIEGSTLVVDPVTGIPRTVQSMVASRQPSIYAYAPTTRAVTAVPVEAWIDSGQKPVVRVTLASGRSLTGTHHHPLLAPDGWRRLDALAVGETVATAGWMPQPTSPDAMPAGELDLLAVMLAEGNTTGRRTSFSNTESDIVELARVGAHQLGAELATHVPGLTYALRGGSVVVPPPGRCACMCGSVVAEGARFLARHGTHPHTQVRRFRVQHGLDKIKAKHKTMPTSVFRLPNSQLARFIAVFWMCDGHITTAGKPELLLASETLVRQFQHLLLRFGVQSRVAYKPATFAGKTFDSWRLSVYSEFLPAFSQHIPVWGRKRERLEARVERVLAAGNPNVGSPSISPELWSALSALAPHCGRKRAGDLRLKDVAARLGWNFAGKVPLRELLSNRSSNGRRYLSKRALRAYLDVLGPAPELDHLTTPQLFWDRIVAIEPAGESHVYDLTVPGPANFVAGDVIAHNTSTTANVSGEIANSGYKTLAIDFDLSGNLRLDLGYAEHPNNDEGRSIYDAGSGAGPLRVIPDVRENLDVVAGGKFLEMLSPLASSAMAADLPGGGVAQAFAIALAELIDSSGYEIVLIDCAPGNPVLQDVALAATRHVVIPTKTDAASAEGLLLIGPRVRRARKINPRLNYLGAVLFGHTTAATRVMRGVKVDLAAVEDTVPLFSAFIRHSETAAFDCRARGQLARELARDARQASKDRLAVLGRHRRGDPPDAIPAALSGSADSLAGDYRRLTKELLERVRDAETAST